MFNEQDKKNKDARIKFNTSLRNEVLIEALSYLAKKIDLLNSINEMANNQNIKAGVLKAVIDENGGAYTTTEEFKRRNSVLNELSGIVDDTIKDIKIHAESQINEAKCKAEEDADIADDNDPNQVALNEKKKGKKKCEINEADVYDNINYNFEPMYQKIDNMGMDELIENIAEKISTAESEFLFNAKDNKRLLGAAIETIGSNISESSDMRQRQEYNRLVNDIVDNRKHTVFSFLVESVSQTVYKEKTLQESYLNEDNSLNLDRVIEASRSMYTILEMCNSLNAMRFTSESLPKILKRL